MSAIARSPILAWTRYAGRRFRGVFDYIHARRGQPRKPDVAVFAFQFEQPEIAQVAQLAAHLVERKRQLDVGEHAPDDLFAYRDRPPRVDYAQDSPARLFTLPLFDIQSVSHR